MAQECLAPAPETVGNAFVAQYYAVLLQKPNEVHKFYQDSSSLSRPGPDGAMVSVKTLQGINDVFLSLSNMIHHARLLTVDSQPSYGNGVMVFVTGFLFGEDKINRKFTQTFFLAPQNPGYFVLNDIFRYTDEAESNVIATFDNEPQITADNCINEEVPDGETSEVIDRSAGDHGSQLSDKNNDNGNKITNHQTENGEISFAEKEVDLADSQGNSAPVDVLPVAEKTSPGVKQDAQKKSYASMVNALKENPAPFQVKIMPKPSEPLRAAPASEVPVSAPSSHSSVEMNNDHSAKGHSIFIRNLPCDATAEQLEAVFKKFGSIKPDGIQVRGFKDQQSCFGFVEFDAFSSVESALQASPIPIGNRNATVEMKRRDNNDSGRFRGGFRNDNFRPRGGFGGRGYGRNEFEKRGDYSGRGRGNMGRNGNTGRSNGNGNSYPRDRYQNGAAPETAKA